MLKTYRATLYTAGLGYVVQALVVNFAPLLFVTFQQEYGFSLSQLSALIAMTFTIQFAGDLILPRFLRRIGTRVSIVLANALAAAGLLLLPVLPELLPPYLGVLTAVLVYSLGSSIVEVLLSPIVEACPFENKSGVMSLLHAFYSWGSVLVILVSTAFFFLFGVNNWRILSALWAIFPIVDGILFTRVPLAELPGDARGRSMSLGQLLREPAVLLLLAMMLTAAGAELAAAQWASAFAETEMGISKSLGDLLGPAFFGVFMGISRLYYARCSQRLDMTRFMIFSAVLCIVSYLLISLSPWSVLHVLGFGLVGFGSAVLWPATLSIGSRKLPRGGTVLFALLAAGGDLGCTLGPAVVGLSADLLGGDLQRGMLVGIAFPILFLLAFAALRRCPAQD